MHCNSFEILFDKTGSDDSFFLSSSNSFDSFFFSWSPCFGDSFFFSGSAGLGSSAFFSNTRGEDDTLASGDFALMIAEFGDFNLLASGDLVAFGSSTCSIAFGNSINSSIGDAVVGVLAGSITGNGSSKGDFEGDRAAGAAPSLICGKSSTDDSFEFDLDRVMAGTLSVFSPLKILREEALVNRDSSSLNISSSSSMNRSSFFGF